MAWTWSWIWLLDAVATSESGKHRVEFRSVPPERSEFRWKNSMKNAAHKLLNMGLWLLVSFSIEPRTGPSKFNWMHNEFVESSLFSPHAGLEGDCPYPEDWVRRALRLGGRQRLPSSDESLSAPRGPCAAPRISVFRVACELFLWLRVRSVQLQSLRAVICIYRLFWRRF